MHALAMNQRPVLFIHGAKDTFVYPKNAHELYQTCRAPKELLIVEDAVHISACYQEPDTYRHTLEEFFMKWD